MADGLALVRFVVRPALTFEEPARRGAHGRGIIGGPCVVHRGVDDREKARADRRLPGDLLRIGEHLVEPLGNDRSCVGRRRVKSSVELARTAARIVRIIEPLLGGRAGFEPGCFSPLQAARRLGEAGERDRLVHLHDAGILDADPRHTAAWKLAENRCETRLAAVSSPRVGFRRRRTCIPRG